MPEIISLTLPYRKMTFERSLEGIKRAGYDSIGFGLDHSDGGYPVEPSLAEADRIKNIIDKHGLGAGLVYGARTATDDADALCRWIDFAAAIDCPLLVWVGVGGYRKFPNEPLTEEQLDEKHRPFVEKMKVVGERAAEKGITVTLKPHTGNTATGPVLKKTLQDIGSPAFKACLDPGNVRYYEGVSPEEDIEPVLDQTAAVIMKDHRGERANGDFPIPGEGDVDFPRILKRLHDVGYSGPLVVERIDGADGGNLTVEEIDARLVKAYDNVVRMAREAGFNK